MADERPIIRVLGFKTTYVKKAGSVELEPREWVRYAPVHNINAVNEEMVKGLIPPEDGLDRDDEGLKIGYMNVMWKQIEGPYKAWKAGTEMPIEGTPLSAWSGVTQEQADVLRVQGIRTVEDVSRMTDSQMGRVMLPGIRGMKTMAAEYLASRGGVETASKVAALEEQNAAMREQLEEMAAFINAQRVEVPSDDEEAPKRRGRPRKVIEDEQEAA